MSQTTVRFPSVPDNTFETVVIDNEFENTFLDVINSGLFVIDSYWHDGSKKIIPKVIVKETGQTVSILPLIGVRPNSKSKRAEGETFYFTRDKFVEDRYIPPLSFKEWIRWLNSKSEYWWEASNRTIHDIQTYWKESTPTVKEVAPVTVPTKTPLDTLMESGLTREEAIKAITQHYFNK